MEEPQEGKHATAGASKRPLRSGDPRAFDLLYEELAPRVLGYALRLTDGARAEAEDLTQETFLAAFTRAHAFKGQSGVLAWLLGIARRRHRDAARTPRPDTLPLSPEMGGSAARTPGPEEAVTRSVVLEAALARLPPTQREALLLVTQQGLTYREAAALLETPIGTLKWRVHEAAQTMRALLAEDATEKTKQAGQEEATQAADQKSATARTGKTENTQERKGKDADASVEPAGPDVPPAPPRADTTLSHFACRR